ncbi:hypothetical protein [Streptomyces sp. Ac-502]|uniref:hypothetical protein n=1 Tax=Streptomyces sp. Ac-502 TaxID=3342801 RepID=UPI003862A330
MRDGLELPASFAVDGGAEQLFMEFGTDFPRSFNLEARDYVVMLEARLGHLEKWQPWAKFTWHAARITETAFVAHRNSTAGLTSEARAEGELDSRH